MSDQVLEALRVALRDRTPLVVVVALPDQLRSLLPEVPPDGGVAADLSVEEFKARYEPDLSLSRIRELCAGGAFPDTPDDRGGMTPGVYKTAKGEWRITMAGIVERQRQERSNGIQRRDRAAAERQAKRQAEDARGSGSDGDGRPPADEAEQSDPQAPAGGSKPPRPRKGKWREALGKEVSG